MGGGTDGPRRYYDWVVVPHFCSPMLDCNLGAAKDLELCTCPIRTQRRPFFLLWYPSPSIGQRILGVEGTVSHKQALWDLFSAFPNPHCNRYSRAWWSCYYSTSERPTAPVSKQSSTSQLYESVVGCLAPGLRTVISRRWCTCCHRRRACRECLPQRKATKYSTAQPPGTVAAAACIALRDLPLNLGRRSHLCRRECCWRLVHALHRTGVGPSHYFIWFRSFRRQVRCSELFD